MGFIPQWARRTQSAWRYRGQERPPFAVVPGPGQDPCRTIRGRPEWYPTPARSLSGWAHTKSPAPDEVCDCWKQPVNWAKALIRTSEDAELVPQGKGLEQ
jgi:hypothetical protein